jgi:hypothetical protein
MKTLFLSAVLSIASAIAVSVQAQPQQPPCSSEHAKQFDFWVGTWDLEWTDAKGNKLKGTNTINKILGGCVIEENFSTGGSQPYLGKSHSLYDAKSGLWKQTWVDSGGAYIDLTGEFKDGRMILRREGTDQKGNKALFRMIFSNIQKDSFLWDWESSSDEGKTWTTNWKINYKRRS